jgi:hypothetical protein
VAGRLRIDDQVLKAAVNVFGAPDGVGRPAGLEDTGEEHGEAVEYVSTMFRQKASA